jgi:hypothetical protein
LHQRNLNLVAHPLIYPGIKADTEDHQHVHGAGNKHRQHQAVVGF